MIVEYPLKKWSKNEDPAKERWKIGEVEDCLILIYYTWVKRSIKIKKESRSRETSRARTLYDESLLSINTEKQIPRLATKSEERNQDQDIWEKQNKIKETLQNWGS